MVFKSCGSGCGLEKAPCHFLNRAAAKHFVLLRTVFGTWDPRKQSHDGCEIRNSFLHVSGLDFACNLVLIPVHGLQDFAEFFLRGSLPSSGNCHCKKTRFLKTSYQFNDSITSFHIILYLLFLWADESNVHLLLLHAHLIRFFFRTKTGSYNMQRLILGIPFMGARIHSFFSATSQVPTCFNR